MFQFFSPLIVILCLWFGVKRRDVVFIQQSLSTDSTVFDSWKFVGRQSDFQSNTICHAGLACLHPFSDTLGQCLRHWPDCQSYLSQLRLAIRLVVASVAFSFDCSRQTVPVQPLALIQIICSLDGCLFHPFILRWKEEVHIHIHRDFAKVESLSKNLVSSDFCGKVNNYMLANQWMRDVLNKYTA